MKFLKSNFAIVFLGMVTAMCLIGCGRPQDKDLQPWLSAFKADGAAFGLTFDTSKLSMQFADLAHPIAGQCSIDNDGNQDVAIDRTYWAQFGTDDYKQLVMYHELGHCLLFRAHVTDYLSIMNPVLLEDGTLDDNRSYLIKELFTQQHSEDSNHAMQQFRNAVPNPLGPLL